MVSIIVPVPRWNTRTVESRRQKNGDDTNLRGGTAAVANMCEENSATGRFRRTTTVGFRRTTNTNV